MQPAFYSRFLRLIGPAKDDTVPLIRPSVTDIFEYSDVQSHHIRSDRNLTSGQRVELLLLLDSMTRVALAAKAGTRQVFAQRPAPTPVRRDLMWSVVRGELVAAS